MWNSGGYLAAAAALAAVGAACLKRSEYERDHFVTEEFVIKTEKIKKDRTLVFLSDIHDKEFGLHENMLVETIRKIRPDAVLIGGDTMVAKKGKADLAVTKRLICGLSGIPIYYGNGNHEQRLDQDRETYGELYDGFVEFLREQKVHYLSDSSDMFGDDICISGLNLEKCHYRDLIPDPLTLAYLQEHLGASKTEHYQILLAHSPLFFKTYAAWGADLTLSGHFHGGTIRLPILGGVMTPQFQFFLPCCAGFFEKKGRYMLVSRGLGTHSINIRLNNRPQLVVIHLKAIHKEDIKERYI